MSDDLINTLDIAKMLGVTRLWVTNSITKKPGFPKPKINLSQRVRHWSRKEVDKWMQQTSAKS